MLLSFFASGLHLNYQWHMGNYSFEIIIPATVAATSFLFVVVLYWFFKLKGEYSMLAAYICMHEFRHMQNMQGRKRELNCLNKSTVSHKVTFKQHLYWDIGISNLC